MSWVCGTVGRRSSEGESWSKAATFMGGRKKEVGQRPRARRKAIDCADLDRDLNTRGFTSILS